MARIPEQTVARLKREVSLLRLVESQGFVLKKHGKDWVTCCPFHDDKTPSLVISEAENLWHCLGACGVGGSIIDWVMKTQGISFRMACELLQHDPSVLAGKTETVRQNTTLKLASPLVSAIADDQALLQQVVDFYHDTLKQSPEAIAYLQTRGLHHAELIDTFKLGFANRTLAYRLPEKNRKAGAEIRTRLQHVGILRESGHEHFNGSLVVPVLDKRGRVVEMYGRKLLDSLRAGTPKHTYLPGEHAGVWNVAALQSSKEIILCEALLDAMTFWVNGFRHVTSSYGVNGFTDEHLEAFKHYGVERVLIAYDRDEAGNVAAEKLSEKLAAENIASYRVLFPKGMDANSYAQKMQPSARALELVLKQAQPMQDIKKPMDDVAMLPVMAEVLSEAKDIFILAAKEKNTPAAESMFVSEPVVAELPPLPVMASPVPPAPALSAVTAEVSGDDVLFTFGDRHYRVRGLDRNTQRDELRVQVMVQRGEHLHMDKLDLYSHKQRQTFVNQASVELCLKEDVIKKELGQLLLALEIESEKRRYEKAASQQQTQNAVTVEGADRAEALSLLRSPELLRRILSDFDRAGVVGEEANKLTGYLACVSRKLDKPLAVMIQSSSAAGKSSLMEAILALMPEEERVQYSAMTGQSLFYMGETNLQHKILAIAEEEGAKNASYALKLLQSEGEVTIASTGKDETTGNLVTREYKVRGPVMLFLTTTAIDIDEELLNRCLVLSVNESREQTQAIHRIQRQKRTLQGLQSKLERDVIIARHRNAQRLLRSLHIINPYADQLTFLDDKTRTRRDHEKYLTLIDSIALLHQHQRDIKTITSNGNAIEYIEVTLSDIENANNIAHEVLGRTLDELPPQTRKLLTLMDVQVRTACAGEAITRAHYRFSRKAVRLWCGWSDTQVRVHLDRLVQLEYVLTHRGGRGQSFEYELLYDGEGEQGAAFMMGLLDIASIQTAKTFTTTESSRGKSAGVAGSTRPQNGEVAEWKNTLQPNAGKPLQDTTAKNVKRTSDAVETLSSRRNYSDASSLAAAL